MAATAALRAFGISFITALGACGPPTLNPPPTGAGGRGGSPASDAARDVAGDAAACGCVVDSNFVLTVSWECYCARWGCTETKPACAANRRAYPSCGLVTDTVDSAGGPWISAWDVTGRLVGKQQVTDVGTYECPSDPTLRGARLRAGRLPDSTCEAVTCSCVDGGTTCTSDAGTDGDTCECRLENSTLYVSSPECFCAKSGWCDVPPGECLARQAYPECGLTVDEYGGHLQREVRDVSGRLVGALYLNDAAVYSCPGVGSAWAAVVGRFPVENCGSSVSCTCTDPTGPMCPPANAASAGGR